MSEKSVKDSLCSLTGWAVGACSGLLVKKFVWEYLPMSELRIKPIFYKFGVYGIQTATMAIVTKHVTKDISDTVDVFQEVIDWGKNLKKSLSEDKPYTDVDTPAEKREDYISIKIKKADDLNDKKEGDDGGAEDAGQQQPAAE